MSKFVVTQGNTASILESFPDIWNAFLNDKGSHLSEENKKTFVAYGRLLANALSIGLGERNEQYNQDGTNIIDYPINGIQDFLYEINKKVRRAISQTKMNCPPGETKGLLAEDLRDIMNYTGYCQRLVDLEKF